MSSSRPLVAISEESVLDEILRIAAAAGCELDCVPDLVAARAQWARAPLVLVDGAMLNDGDGQLPRRGGVVLVTGQPLDVSGWETAYAAGVERVLTLPDAESALVDLLADTAEEPTEGRGAVLGVIGGRGGAGASVFAASVAIAHADDGGDALLVDCDALSGGIDLVLGAEHTEGLRWPDVTVRAGRVSMSALRDALPEVSGGAGRLVVLSCGRSGDGPAPEAVSAVIDAGVRSGYTVVCDLPRHLGSAGWQVVDVADLIAVIVPAEVRATASAHRLVERLRHRSRRVGLVVRGPSPDALPADVVADVVDGEPLAVMRAEPRLARALERGEFRPRRGGPLAGGAADVLNALRVDSKVAA
ncbi:septum site-determining protein Ssd [Haloechinothrix salitolerans]|uniref:Septum site-determining protein Ssd n=1 Tax=Haloechinothrix salitolerans TaxID=926830 RepID=A0ABW2BSZ3_9PSEU